MGKYKSFISDSMWSIAALLVMNVVLQIILYPILRSFLGAKEYGNVLYLMGIVNIAATSVGCSANNSRLKSSRDSKNNGLEYNIFLGTACLVYLPLTFLVLSFYGKENGIADIFLYWLLICMTTYRNYADVKYRLTVNYRGYFFYYIGISVGYLAGIGLFCATHKWMLLFLTGEFVSVVIALWQNRKKIWKEKKTELEVKSVFYSTGVLLSAQLLVNIALNADRLVLKAFVSSTAVTVYYVASLIGKTAALLTAPLNSVVIGHLAKRNGNLSVMVYLKIAAVVLAGIGASLLVCVLGSHVFVSLFYPQEYEAARPLFIWANAASLFYFFTGIIMMVLLRYINERYQLLINGIYCIVFFAFTIPITAVYGIKGFSIALFVVNLFRFILAVAVGAAELKK